MISKAKRKEIYTKWVAALRSGEYKKTTRRLRADDKFCCLGVLCEVVGKRWNANQAITVKDREYLALLPPGFAGLSYDTTCALADMNDGIYEQQRGKSFKAIATWIEKNLIAPLG